MKKRTKHTIKGRHGHVYKMSDGGKKSLFGLERECVDAVRATEMDIPSEQLEAVWRVSRRYRTCVSCHHPTTIPGAWAKPGRKDVLYYECDACYRKSGS